MFGKAVNPCGLHRSSAHVGRDRRLERLQADSEDPNLLATTSAGSQRRPEQPRDQEAPPRQCRAVPNNGARHLTDHRSSAACDSIGRPTSRGRARADPRVDTDRIHRYPLTGLRYGGNGVYDYLYLVLQDDSTSYLAAGARIAGHTRSAIWVVVGSNDRSNFSTSRSIVTGYDAQDAAALHAARLTV